MKNQFDALRPSKRPRQDSCNEGENTSMVEDEENAVFEKSRTPSSKSQTIFDGLRVFKISVDECVVGLNLHESWSFIGLCKVKTLKGTAKICGHTLSSTQSRICFSSSNYSPLSITCDSSVSEDDSDLLPENVREFDVKQGPFASLIHIQSVRDDRFKLSGEKLFSPSRNTEMFIKGVHKPTDPQHSLFIPANWKALTVDIVHQQDLPIICVCGSKNQGKSTFGRFLVNEMLDKYDQVCFLDTDVGQCEFTPPGIISLTVVSDPLLGPPFTHLAIQHAQMYGSTSPDVNPVLYLKKILRLFQIYEDKYKPQGMPLVINTHGWIRGVGLETVQHIIQLIRPGHIVQIVSLNQEGEINHSELVTYGIKSEVRREWWETETIPVTQSQLENWNYNSILFPTATNSAMLKSRPSSSESRNLSILSYFLAPSIPLSTVKINLREVETEYDHNYSQFEVLDILRWSLVGFLNETDDLVDLAIVTSAEPETSMLTFKTPLNSKDLNCKNIRKIRRFQVDLPVELIERFSYPQKSLPYVDSHVIDGIIGHNIRKTRRNLIRKYHFKRS